MRQTLYHICGKKGRETGRKIFCLGENKFQLIRAGGTQTLRDFFKTLRPAAGQRPAAGLYAGAQVKCGKKGSGHKLQGVGVALPEYLIAVRTVGGGDILKFALLSGQHKDVLVYDLSGVVIGDAEIEHNVGGS